MALNARAAESIPGDEVDPEVQCLGCPRLLRRAMLRRCQCRLCRGPLCSACILRLDGICPDCRRDLDLP